MACHLPDAIGLVEQLETSPAAAADLQQWRKKLAAGTAKFSELAAGNRLIPPLFVWVVASAGEDLTAGFNRAAEIYHVACHLSHRSRALFRAADRLAVPRRGRHFAGVFGHQHVFAAHRHAQQHERIAE